MLIAKEASLVILVSVFIIASIIDLTQHRIPNMLSAFIALYGIVAHLYLNLGLHLPIAGMALGLLMFLPFHLCGGMGAGDVKLMSAVGAVLGLKVIIAAGLTLLVGSIMGLFIVLKDADGRQAILIFIRKVIRLDGWEVQGPQIDVLISKRFPYAIAITAGTLLAIGFTTPWIS